METKRIFSDEEVYRDFTTGFTPYTNEEKKQLNEHIRIKAMSVTSINRELERVRREERINRYKR